MSDNDFLTGVGVTIEVNLSGSVWTPLETAISIDGPKISGDEVEGPLRLNSTFRRYRSMPNSGEASITVEHDDADPGCIALQAMVAGGPAPTYPWRITYGNGYIHAFSAFSKGYEKSTTEVGEAITAEVPLRLTTPITITAPTP